MSVASDRLFGINNGVAFKPACRVATTANITLSGLQTVNGVVLAAADRVLVKNQTDTTANGLYDVATGAWSRCKDFDGNRDVILGTLVYTLKGDSAQPEYYYLNFSGDIEFDTTALTFVLSPGAGSTGPAGASGATGAQGIQGSTGAQGPTGATGSTGATGPQGIQGSTGATGQTGPQGLQGPRGVTGATGATGTQGDIGITWRSSWATSTAYALRDSVTDNGSTYICVTAHTSAGITEPGVGASWASYWDIVALGGTGPMGPIGPTGLTGATGSQGPQGLSGSGTGDMLAAQNLNDLANKTTARVNLGVAIGTDVQAFDAELSALAGLISAADKLPYFTGSGAAALATFTAGGRALVNSAGTSGTFPYFSGSNTVTLGTITAAGLALIDDAAASNQRTTLGSTTVGDAVFIAASAAAARTAIGAVIGTDVQAFDAELAAIAALPSAADKLPYYTGTGSAALADFTGVARTLVGQTTQALMRTTGLGSTTVGDAIFTAASASAARVTLGSTTVGDAVFIAASASAARTAIGTVIGTDVQAYDGELAALAGLTSAANAVPVFTGSGTAGLITLTASTLVGMGASGSAAKITLGTGLSMSGAVLNAAVSSYRGAVAYTSAPLSVSNNTATIVNFDLESIDTDSIHSTSANTSRMTVPSGVTTVRLFGQTQFPDTTDTTARQITFYKNGVALTNPVQSSKFGVSSGGASDQFQCNSSAITCVAGDYFEMAIYQVSGGSISAAADATWFEMQVLA